jgi:hypothetical protein
VIERRGNHSRDWRLLFVTPEGVPQAVQHIRVIESPFGARVRWRDCAGRTYERLVSQLIGRELQLHTRDHLYVCQNYVRAELERNVHTWWEPTK